MWPERAVVRRVAGARRPWAWLALAWLVALPAAGQQPRRYLVEVVVFAREVSPDPHYRWPGEPDVSGALVLDPVEPPPPDEAGYPQLVVERDFMPVDPEASVGAAARLRRLGGYRVIAQQAWIQEAAVLADGTPVRLHSDDVVEPPPPAPTTATLFGEVEEPPEPTWSLDGLVAFERGRYPHLTVDLVYRRPAAPPAPGSALLRTTVGATAASRGYETYRIRQRQQLRYGRLHYFDHPQFGVLAVVRPVVPAPEDEEGTDTDLP